MQKNFYDGRKKIIKGFKEGIFPLKSNDESKRQQTSKKFNEKESPNIVDVKEFNELIIKKEKDIDREIFKNYFGFQTPSSLLKNLYNLNDEAKNNDLVNVIKNELKDLKEEIKEMSTEEREIEKLDKIIEIAEAILEFNKQNQEGKELKILTPNQMLSRLPVSLAQIEAAK